MFHLPDECRVVLVECFPAEYVLLALVGGVDCEVAFVNVGESRVGGKEVVVAAVFNLHLALAALQPFVESVELVVGGHALFVAHVVDVVERLGPQVEELVPFL